MKPLTTVILILTAIIGYSFAFLLSCGIVYLLIVEQNEARSSKRKQEIEKCQSNM